MSPGPLLATAYMILLAEPVSSKFPVKFQPTLGTVGKLMSLASDFRRNLLSHQLKLALKLYF
jgi:hypothetical protein